VIPPIVVHCGFGSLLAVLSLPLVFRKVPMNRAYGVRIPKAFESERSWYAINAYGGRLLLVYGLLLVLYGWMMRDSAPPPSSLWTAPFVVGPLLLVFPILGLVNAYARRLP
jgi:SdpI/YfhL protein family